MKVVKAILMPRKAVFYLEGLEGPALWVAFTTNGVQV
jgi:hypothetical protein